MSFSQQVKAELMNRLPAARHCQIAMLTALICTTGQITIDDERRLKLHFACEQEELKKVCEGLVNKIFGYEDLSESAQVYKVLETTKLLHFTEDILRRKKKVLNEKNLRWDGIVFTRSCCKRAFLKGIFLAVGSVNNPEKAYHLEMVFESQWMAMEVCSVLRDMEIEGKLVQRKKYYVVYMKDGSTIVDFLNIIGAPLALMEMENIRIFKDVKNLVNRRVNCETANINKTVSASRKQIEDIRLIEACMGFQKLPEPLKQLAELRLEEPDASLKELGEMLNPPVTKSGVNHRLRKLSQIANDLK